MVRTIISLREDDKRWLDERAEAEGVSMTEVVRRAIERYRATGGETPLRETLRLTRGIWTQGDGLGFQRTLRGEWG